MAKRERLYRRLPGTGYRLQVYSRLWLGPDHLLWVESTGFSERYKRFYYGEIQAIQIQRTKTGLWFTAGFALLLLIPLLIALWVTGVWRVVWLVIAGTFSIPLIVHLLLGPTCVCLLHTAVQSEKVRSLGRLRRARKVVGVLKDRIETAQGTISRDDVLSRLGDTTPTGGDIWINPAAREAT